MSKEEVQNYIDGLCHTTVLAILNFDVWWCFKEEASRKKYVDTMNGYAMFFKTSIHAHFVALLVALYRLYETRPDTINIPELLKRLEACGSFEQDAIAEARRLFDERARPLWVKVSILRNEGYAHLSKDYSYLEIFQKADITPDELKDLIDKTKELMSVITSAWDRSIFGFSGASATEDTIRMLEDLKQFHDDQARR